MADLDVQAKYNEALVKIADAAAQMLLKEQTWNPYMPGAADTGDGDDECDDDSPYDEFICTAQDAREDLINLVDQETVAGNADTAASLQSAVDSLTKYIQQYMAMEDDWEQANQTYADQNGSVFEAVLNTSQRKRAATIVRKRADGKKEYKFPIPDKAHARAALARINQSDLSPAEKAKVRRRASRMLGKGDGEKAKESSVGVPEKIAESKDDQVTADPGTIEDVQEDFELITLSEANFARLAQGELIVKVIQPGFNRGNGRYYKREAISEAVAAGRFNNLKMHFDHPTNKEMADRPERSLNTWVSTLKESWVDPASGSAMGKVKIVRSWFRDFLEEVKESGSLGDLGVSILANGKLAVGTVNGQRTKIVESLTKTHSVDWVTEPGAGGRIEQIWESYQPMKIQEEEFNVLSSMKPDEVIETLKRERADVITLLEAERRSEAERETLLKETEEQQKKAEAEKAQLEEQLKEATAKSEQLRIEIFKHRQRELVSESLSDVKLPPVAKSRIMEWVMQGLPIKDEELDEENVKESVKKQVQVEQEYAAELLKESGSKGEGIKGLGGGGKEPESPTTSAFDKVERDLAKRFGFAPKEATNG